MQDKKLALINIVGLSKKLINKYTPHLLQFSKENQCLSLEEPFPAVTCTSQSNILTGKNPSQHGIIGNGWFFKELAEVGFWKQNNNLVESEKIWDKLKKKHSNFTCANLFWWYNMYSTVDWSITPRPHYPADGRKVFDIYTYPYNIKENIKKSLGKFPFMNFWGPNSNIKSSQWIAESAKWIYDKHQPNLNLVYLPHLDYCLQKEGPHSININKELTAIDNIFKDLLDFYRQHQVEVWVLSEYGMHLVDTPLYPNRILRKNNYLSIQKSLSWELIDFGASEAFAVSDHQICHIYVKNKKNISKIAHLFERENYHQDIIYGEKLKNYHLNHRRSGDIILMAKTNCWYTYYYWLDNKKAPDFANCIDIHRKPGYDPCELFFRPIPFIKLKIIWTLIKKLLGFRYYLNIIPLNPNLVKGSHGTPHKRTNAGPLFISTLNFKTTKSIPLTKIHSLILKYFNSK